VIGGDWFGKGETIGAAAAGVPLRDVGALLNPSGKSFHAGKFVAVVYVVMAGDWVEARGGGGTEPPIGGGAPNDCCRG
jgi:hypothetical protein